MVDAKKYPPIRESRQANCGKGIVYLHLPTSIKALCEWLVWVSLVSLCIYLLLSNYLFMMFDLKEYILSFMFIFYFYFKSKLSWMVWFMDYNFTIKKHGKNTSRTKEGRKCWEKPVWKQQCFFFFSVYMTLQIVVKHNQSKIAHANSWFSAVCVSANFLLKTYSLIVHLSLILCLLWHSPPISLLTLLF